MKTNLNNYILPNKTYIAHLCDTFLWDEKAYDAFASESCSDKPYLAPYLFTLSNLLPKDRKAFEIFYMNYLNRSGIFEGDRPGDLSEFVMSDLVFSLTFIATAQYYFL